ncbi:hypothetical protein [Actinoplanes couchii]|uniref:Chorismate mutase n=1 Tax=Actinoplanes couchii TaxID=403638 RepID=A0ABQ3XEB3_9ACTN|nr:hypothetical protein [Actinoplanes couchii]MDR6319713.1 hypothetical protein [Actinoplanes couchii]GID56847.1 hypothetical protein Aco03nite_052510 [Actinoplanes couchii]
MTVGTPVTPEDLFAPEPEADPCDSLDDLLISMLIDRTLRARGQHEARAEAGLPVRKMAWEYAMVKRYTSRLGPEGAEIARAMLALAHSRSDLPPDA